MADFVDIDLSDDYAAGDGIVETQTRGRPGIAGTLNRWAGAAESLLRGEQRGGSSSSSPASAPSLLSGLPSWAVPAGAVVVGAALLSKLRKRKRKG